MGTLLVLSVGSMVGTNILDAVQALRPRLRVLGLNSVADAHNNFRCDRVYLAPAARDADAYWQRVRHVLSIEQPDVVLAGREQDLSLMADWRAQHSVFANRLLVGPPSLTSALTDKLSSHDWAVSRGLPFAPTVAATDPTAREQALAWMAEFDCALIAKPRAGNGSRGVRLLLDQAALTAALGDSELVIQPYLSDAGSYRMLQQQSKLGLPLFWAPTLIQYVSQTVIGPNGELLGRCDVETTMTAGRCVRTRMADDPALRVIGDRYAQSLAEAGWRGPVNAQLVRHPRLGFQVIEFCPGATGGMMPRLLLGFDEMALVLSAWTGQAFERRPALPISQVALRVTRDVGQDEAASTALSEYGSWPPAPSC